jgi:hypothetical protein
MSSWRHVYRECHHCRHSDMSTRNVIIVDMSDGQVVEEDDTR